MPIFEVWFATCVASIVSDGYLGVRVFKDIADEGYKIDSERLKEVNAKANPNVSKLDYLIKIIPGLNIVFAFKKGFVYGKNSGELIDSLKSEGAIVPMTDEEYAEYQKKPTLLNAWKITQRKEQKKETNAEMSRRVQVAVKKRYTPEEKKPEYEVVHKIRISYNPPDSGKQKAQEEIPSVEEDFEPNLNARTALLAQKADLMIQKEEMGAAEEEEPTQSMRSGRN